MKTYFSWSSGKDAALALYHLQNDQRFEVEKLVTTVNAHYNRVSMHGLRRELLEKQAQETGIPLSIIALPEQPSMEEYENLMNDALGKVQAEGFKHCGFGDIFLEDLRAYRENQLKPVGISGTFPLWKKNTKALIHEFLDLNFKALIICIKSDLLDESFIGREIDASLIKDLPPNVDPCGENGEFHTFCFDGPIFANPVKFKLGEKVFREYKAPDQNNSNDSKSMGFWFVDLIPD